MRRPRKPFDRDDLQEVDPYRYDRLKSFSNVKPVLDGFSNFVKITMSSLTLLTAFGICVLTIFVWIDLAKVPNLSELERYNAGAALALYDANDKLISEFPAEQQREVVRLCDISPNLTRAVLTAEDHNFFEHHGVEWEAIERAWQKNQRAEVRAERVQQRRPGRAVVPKVVGGSTITQQLAKNLFLDAERTLPRKAQELVIALLLDTMLSKQRLLEIYLNNVEWGEGLFGAQAASRHYFRTDAAKLQPWQAARLAVMLPAPKRFERNPGSPYVASRSATIVARMNDVVLP